MKSPSWAGVVFLHGGNGRAQDWANQFPVLAPDYTAIALDIAGTVNREGPKTEAEYSIPLIADDVLELLNLLGFANAVSPDTPSRIRSALQFAVTHQDRLAGLVPVDTSSGPYGRREHQNR